MKPSPFRFVKIGIVGAAVALALNPHPEICAQETPEAIPSSDGNQIIHTILREGDVNFSLAGRPRGGGDRHQHGEKGRPEKSKGNSKKSEGRQDDRKKDGDRPKGKDHHKDSDKKEQPQKKDGDAPKAADCKKDSAPKTAGKPKSSSEGKKADCDKCKKPAAPLAKKEPALKMPHNQPEKWEGRPKQIRPEDMRARQEEMRERFEEMRKRGGPWAENRSDRKPAGPDVRELVEKLEAVSKELEHARKSLHMAHKELGDKTLHIEKLEDQVQNFRTQLSRAESEMRRLHQMKGSEQKEFAEALQNERRRNEALQNDVQVIQKKAKEAIAKIEAQAKQHVAKSEAEMQEKLRHHADILRKKMTPEPQGTARRAEPQKSLPKRPDAKSRGTTSRSPRKPEPNKPADPEMLSIAPIEYKAKSAVNFEERTRVLNDVTALLKKSPDAKIKIIGHADDSTYDQVNKDISINRASFLSSFLRVNGIDSSKISHEGIGNSAPKKGAANNRRVVIEIVK